MSTLEENAGHLKCWLDNDGRLFADGLVDFEDIEGRFVPLESDYKPLINFLVCWNKWRAGRASFANLIDGWNALPPSIRTAIEKG